MAVSKFGDGLLGPAIALLVVAFVSHGLGRGGSDAILPLDVLR
jgi:hypothetical protein